MPAPVTFAAALAGVQARPALGTVRKALALVTTPAQLQAVCAASYTPQGRNRRVVLAVARGGVRSPCGQCYTVAMPCAGGALYLWLGSSYCRLNNPTARAMAAPYAVRPRLLPLAVAQARVAHWQHGQWGT